MPNRKSGTRLWSGAGALRAAGRRLLQGFPAQPWWPGVAAQAASEFKACMSRCSQGLRESPFLPEVGRAVSVKGAASAEKVAPVVGGGGRPALLTLRGARRRPVRASIISLQLGGGRLWGQVPSSPLVRLAWAQPDSGPLPCQTGAAWEFGRLPPLGPGTLPSTVLAAQTTWVPSEEVGEATSSVLLASLFLGHPIIESWLQPPWDARVWLGRASAQLTETQRPAPTSESLPTRGAV